jgi:hypothetical protein
MKREWKDILVKVIRASDGHEFVIYTDGHTEGFGEPVGVWNRLPLLLHDFHYEMRNGIKAASRQGEMGITSDSNGATEHSVPETPVSHSLKPSISEHPGLK